MVGIFTGLGSGFERSSVATLGGAGLLGSASLGRSGQGLYLNAATGGLVIGKQDEFLAGRGLDLSITRTYDSMGNHSDDNGDNWRQSTDRRIKATTATINTAGSTATRVSGDGTEIAYTYNQATRRYETTLGTGAYDTLSFASDAWTWTDGDTQTVEKYMPQGTAGEWKITSQTDVDGRAITYAYTSTTTTITTSDGSTITCNWAGNNLTSVVTGYVDLVTSTAHTETRTSYTYQSGRLWKVTVDLTPDITTDSKTYVTTYGYDGQGRVTSITETDGTSVTVTYHAASGKVEKISQAVSSSEPARVLTFAYDTTANKTTVTDSAGRTTTLEFNASDDTLKSVTLPPAAAGATAQKMSYTYLDPSHVASVTDGMGQTTYFEYTRGNLTRRYQGTGTNPVNWTKFTYDQNNRRLTETTISDDGDGVNVEQSTWYTYDSAEHLVYTIDTLGQVREYRYGTGYGAGILSAIVAYAEQKYNVVNATVANTPQITTEQVNSWKSDFLNLSSVEIASYVFDDRGNLKSSRTYGVANTDGSASVAEGYSNFYFVYDQAGRLLSRRQNSVAAANAEQYLYDGLGRVVFSVDPSSGATTIVYSDAAATTTVTLASGLVALSSFNKAGDLIAASESVAGVTTRSSTMTYDGTGRLKSTSTATDLITPTYISDYLVYDDAGRIVGRVEADGALTEYVYDQANRVVSTIRYLTRITPAQLSQLASPTSTLTIGALRPSGSSVDRSWSIYDKYGRLIEAVTGDGSVVAYYYDQSGRVVQTSHLYNKLTATQLSSISPTQTTRLLPAAYASKDLLSRTFYSRSGQRIGEVDAGGFVTKYVYNAADRLVQVTSYSRATTATVATASFTSILNGVSTNSSADRTTRYVYDGQGLLRYVVDSLSHVTQYDYDFGSNSAAVTIYDGVLNATSDYTFDNVERLITDQKLAAVATNRASWTLYNERGEIAYTIDADRGVVEYLYDASGNVSKTTAFATPMNVTQRPGPSTMTTWVNAHRSDAENRVTHAYFDASGRLIWSVDAEGYAIRQDYDPAGRLVGVYRYDNRVVVTDTSTSRTIASALGTSPYGVTVYVYDAQGRVVDQYDRIASGDSATTRTHSVYNADDTLASVTIAYNTTSASTTSFTYDANGRVRYTTRGAGAAGAATTEFQYDGLGNVIKVIDPRLNATTRVYDSVGNLVSETDALLGTTFYEYNAFGDRVLATDAIGGQTFSYYDRVGRVVAVCDAELYLTKTFYTALGDIDFVKRYGNRVGAAPTVDVTPPVPIVASVDAVTSFTYDRLGRVTSTTDAENYVESYVLNVFGDRETVTNTLNGTTTNVYDDRGSLKQETLAIAAMKSDGTVEAATIVNSYEYDARGNRTKVTLGDNVAATERVTTFVYNELNQLIHVDYPSVIDGIGSTSAVPTEDYSYDLRGNLIKTVRSLTGSTTSTTIYYYDALDRKSGERDALGILTTYDYDLSGNVVAQTTYATAVAASTTQPSASAGDFRRTRFLYDALGRLTDTIVDDLLVGTASTTTFTTSTASVSTHYTYDAVGNRIMTTSGIVKIGSATVSGFQQYKSYSYHDKLGRVTDVVDEARYLTHSEYDSDGNVVSELRYATAIDALMLSTAAPPAAPTPSGDDRLTTFTYDRNGRRRSESRTVQAWQVTSPTGTLTEYNVPVTIWYEYNGFGEVTKKTEATGEYITYQYDAFGRLELETRPGFLDFDGDSVSPITRYAYNGFGDLVRTEQTDGLSGTAAVRVTRYAYDRGGRQTVMVDAANKTINYSYDLAGRKVGESYARGDSSGSTPSTVNEGLTYRYDALGRVTRQAFATIANGVWTQTGDHTQMVYNAYGDVTDRGVNTGAWEGLQEHFTYDGAGRMVKTNSGDGVWRFFVSDARGNQTLQIESEGTWLGDMALADVLALAQPGPNVAIGNGYVDGINVTLTVYDERSQAKQIRQAKRQKNATATPTDFLTWKSYNAFGEVKTTITPDGATSYYSYNAMGRLLSVDHAGTWEGGIRVGNESGGVDLVDTYDRYYYDKSGRLIGQEDANGNRNTRRLLAGTGYGDAEALVTAEYHADTGKIVNGYDVFGDRRTETDATNLVTTNLYDALGRLKQQNHAGGLIDYYSYDAIGQRIRHANNVFSGLVEKTDYDIQGRVTSQIDFSGDVTTTSYSFSGAITTVGLGTYYGWIETTTYANNRTSTEKTDTFGHVLSTTGMNGGTASTSYDYAGRITKVEGTESRYYTYFNTGLAATVRTSTGSESAGNYDQTGDAYYSYDAIGRKTGEIARVQDPVLGWIATENSTAQYDSLGRMTSWTENGQGYIGSSSATPAAAVVWTYDAAGNVRSQIASYRALDAFGTAAATATAQETWFLYDSMNRMTRQGEKSGSAIVRGGFGIDIAYDAAGRRALTTRSESYSFWVPETYEPYRPGRTVTASRIVKERYVYNADGTLHDLWRTAGTGAEFQQSYYEYDRLGRLTVQVDYSDEVLADGNHRAVFRRGASAAEIARGETAAAIVYDNAGRILRERDYSWQSDSVWLQSDIVNDYGTGTAGYALGALLGSTVTTSGAGVTTGSSTTTNTVGWYANGPVVTGTAVTSSAAPGINTTAYTLSPSGLMRLARITESGADARSRTVTFRHDALGQVLRRDEADANAGGDPHAIWYRFDGREIGAVGNDSKVDTTYLDSVETRGDAPGPGAFRGGAQTGVAYARFGQGFDSVSSYAQGSDGGRYTVNAGDTLSGIALQLWGDASLWYKLAQANGLTADSALVEGQTLTVPAGVIRTANNASTVRPYDPSDAYGNTSPTTPKPIPPKVAAHKNKCGVFGQILLVAIAVAVTIWAAPAAPSVWQGALAGLAGSAASQAVGLATGIQDKLDFKGLAISALSGGVGAGLGQAGKLAELGKITGGAAKAATFLNSAGTLSTVARGMVASGITQGISYATGLQSNFDWAGVAAAGVGAAAGGVIGGGYAGAGADLVASSAARSLMTGTNFGDNLMSALPGVIGNTIGNLVAGGIAGGGKSKATGKPIDLLPEGMYDTTPDPVVAPGSQTAIVSSPTATDADAQPGDIVVTGVRDAVYRPGIDAGLFFRTQYEENSRARIGGNGGPPLEDWRVLRELGRTRPNGPTGALYGISDQIFDPTKPAGLLDDALDLTGPATEAQAGFLDDSIRSSVGEILSIDPGHRFPDRLGASGPEAQSLRWKAVDADFYLSELAATKYIYQGDVGALQNETLRVYQKFVDQGFAQALDEAAAGTLYQPAGWSRAQAIGSRMDGIARDDMRAFYAEHRINPGLDINVTVNNRPATQPEGSYRIPDVRVGGVIFDASISPKQSYAPQIQGFYSSPVVRSVFIVRPTSMGGAYALPKTGGR